MEILLWLVPPFVVTVLAMVWVGWVGREGRGEVDDDEAVRRLGVALEKDPKPLPHEARLPRERSTGVAVRRVGGGRAASASDGGRAASAASDVETRRRDLAS